MIPVLGPPRQELTAAQVRCLITEAPAVTYEARLDLLDVNDAVVQVGLPFDATRSSVSRDVEAEQHMSASLLIAQALDWGSARLRLWLSLTGHAPPSDLSAAEQAAYPPVTAMFNLGVYLCDTPEEKQDTVVYDADAGTTSYEYEVTCYDKLQLLRIPLDEPFEADVEGTSVLDHVRVLIDLVGEGERLRLDSSKEGVFHATGQFWPVDGSTTVLSVVNELLEHIAYRPLYTDIDGFFASDPVVPLSTQAVEWTYDDGTYSVIGANFQRHFDFFDLPNRFIYVLDTPSAGLPDEGDGRLTRLNQSDGPSSIDARGRTITGIYRMDANDQEALESKALADIERVSRSADRLRFSVAPNPLHFGRPDAGDLIAVDAYEVDTVYELRKWNLPLDGSNMDLECWVFDPPELVEP